MQSAAILRMRRALELLLQMHKTARGLDQTLEIIRVVRFGAEPEMFEDIVRFVIPLLVPAAKKSGVARMLRDVVRLGIGRRAAQLFDEAGNSLVFAHGKLNFEPLR